MLGGVIASAILHSTSMLALSLSGAIVVAIVITVSNVYFGNKNRAAALLAFLGAKWGMAGE
jgi:prepilin signal peptidase PulO-like enzyme (type II secretory pathway)